MFRKSAKLKRGATNDKSQIGIADRIECVIKILRPFFDSWGRDVLNCATLASPSYQKGQIRLRLCILIVVDLFKDIFQVSHALLTDHLFVTCLDLNFHRVNFGIK